MTEASVAVRLVARGLIDTFRGIGASRDVLRQDASMPPTLRRGMALVSMIALESGYPDDVGAQVNAFTAMACKPVRDWGPQPFRLCEEAAAILVDEGFSAPTHDCLQLASGGDESSIIEDLFHERLRAALAAVGPEAATLYRKVREGIIRKPCRTKADVLAFAQGSIELAGDIPGFFRRLPAAALHGHTLRLCARCSAPLFPDRDTASYPIGRCAVRECRMTHPIPAAGEEHEVANPEDWRIADHALMTFWVGPGLPEIALHDALKAVRDDVELYPMCDLADVSIGGTDIGIDVKSYSSAAVIGQKFASGIGGLMAFRRKIVAIPDMWIRIDRDYLRTAAAVSGCPQGIEFMSITNVLAEYAR
jgi:hypothetical protein